MAALLAITLLIVAASVVSFAESYRGLYEWAVGHGLAGTWAALFPLQTDTFIAVGELSLFVALADRWQARSRVAAWLVTLAGLAASLAGNVGHVGGAGLTVHLTAAVPPLAASAALAVGLGVLKRVVAGHDRPPATVTDKRTAVTADTGHDRTAVTDTAAAAMTALAGQPDMTAADLAAAIGVSERTARRYRARLGNGHATAA